MSPHVLVVTPDIGCRLIVLLYSFIGIRIGAVMIPYSKESSICDSSHFNPINAEDNLDSDPHRIKVINQDKDE